MRVPNLESMIEKVYNELSEQELLLKDVIEPSLSKLDEVNKIVDAATKMNLLITQTSGSRWVADIKQYPVKGGSVTSVINNSLLITNDSNGVPPRLTAPIIPSTLGDKSSFKPGRPRKRAKS